MTYGLVSLVGAGPGDPELITLKALRRLRAADVVVYDALANRELLAECRPTAALIDVGKRAGCRPYSQEAINALLVDLARDHGLVVRLKGGDPFVFGRGGEEAMALRAAGIAFEIVPGISSAIAVPAYAGIPVTQRGVAVSFAVVTGHEDPTKPASQINWAALAGIGTLVFLMGVTRLREISAQLCAHGLSAETPAAVVQWGTTADQVSVVGTLATIAEDVARAGVGSPATLVVGEVVRLRDRLSWFDTLNTPSVCINTEHIVQASTVH
jgi:uroporphyrin-III C-methyltransferase